MATSSVAYNKPVLPRVSDTSDLASNRASVYSGKALDFDGVNDSISIPSSVTSLNITGNKLSIAGWFVHDGSGSSWQTILYKDTGNNVGYQLFVDGNSRLAFGINTGTFYRYTSTDIIKTNTLYFFTCTYDGATMKIYLNGALDTSNNATGNILSSSTTFYIGRNNGGSEWFNGRISGIRIWDTDLTATQVAELYNNPEQILPTGVSAVNLKLWLPMMEGAGAYVYNGAAGALGEELLANGTLDEVCQKWGLSDVATVAIAGGKIVWLNPASGGAFADQYISVSTGKTYRITFDYTASDYGFLYIGDQYTAIPLGTGKFSVDLTYSSGAARIRFAYGSSSSLSASIDNVSVKEVVPKYYGGAITGATWVAGLGEPLPQTALMDWNKYDSLESASDVNYYTGSLTVGSNSGTVVMRHIPFPGSSYNYYYTFGSQSTGFHRALGRINSSYWFVGYGAGSQDFATSASITNGLPTDIVSSWDASGNVSIYQNGNFIQTASKTLGNFSGTRTLYLYRSAWTAGDPQSIIFWAYYDRQLSVEEIHDIYYGVVEPTDVSDLKYYFTPQNNYSYNGVTLSKTGSLSSHLSPKGLTTSKDILGNAIAKPRSAGAFNFDGASWVEIQDNPSVDTVIPMTIEAWVYNNTGELSANNRYMPIFDKATGSNGTSGFTLRVYSTYSANGGYLGIGGTFSPFNFTDGSYQHIVAVIEPSSQKIYINGSLQNSFTNAWTVSTNSSPLRIGYASSDGSQWLYGQIASPRVYNYALTAEQVADNFNQKASTFGKSTVTSELQAYINRTVAAGATVEAHSALLNTLTELENK